MGTLVEIWKLIFSKLITEVTNLLILVA